MLNKALALNIPILVNKKILGSWKYVNSMTGMFFDTNEIIYIIKYQILHLKHMNPKNGYKKNYNVDLNLESIYPRRRTALQKRINCRKITKRANIFNQC